MFTVYVVLSYATTSVVGEGKCTCLVSFKASTLAVGMLTSCYASDIVCVSGVVWTYAAYGYYVDVACVVTGDVDSVRAP